MTIELRCSFCRKSEHHVRKLVSGAGGGYICDACVLVASRIIRDSDSSPEGWSAWRRFLSRVRAQVGRFSPRARVIGEVATPVG